jgi:hypothetical protein
MKIMKKLLTILLVLTAMASGQAQDNPGNYKPTGVYNVKFVVSELENGKVTNQRVYTVMMREDRKASLKTGNRVPIATGSYTPGSSAAATQFQYLDVGFNVDCLISEREGKLDMDIDADLSGMVPPEGNVPTVGNNPVLRQVRQNVRTSLPEGKPTIVTSMDDVSSKKTVQLEVTVTKIKKI